VAAAVDDDGEGGAVSEDAGAAPASAAGISDGEREHAVHATRVDTSTKQAVDERVADDIAASPITRDGIKDSSSSRTFSLDEPTGTRG
jgi:hypothetical protein